MGSASPKSPFFRELAYCFLLVATPAQAMGSASPKSPFFRPACITLDLVKYIVLPSPRSTELSYWGMTILITLHWAPLAPGTRQILVHTAPSSVSSTVCPLLKHWGAHLASAANLTHLPILWSRASVSTQASSSLHCPPLVMSQSLASPSSSLSSSSSSIPFAAIMVKEPEVIRAPAQPTPLLALAASPRSAFFWTDCTPRSSTSDAMHATSAMAASNITMRDM